MCTVLLSPGVNPIAFDKYIDININMQFAAYMAVWFIPLPSYSLDSILHHCIQHMWLYVLCASV
jgi:hypothetical protein